MRFTMPEARWAIGQTGGDAEPLAPAGLEIKMAARQPWLARKAAARGGQSRDKAVRSW